MHNRYGLDTRSYFLFNCICAGIITAMLFYAGFFAYDDHAVKCVYKTVTGNECATCGLTRGFHHILTGDFKKATQLNTLSIQLFLFFAVQLIIRIYLIFAVTKNNVQRIVKWDVLLSVILFVICFFPLIAALFKY